MQPNVHSKSECIPLSGYALKVNADFNQSIVEMNVDGDTFAYKHAVFEPRTKYFSITFIGKFIDHSKTDCGLMSFETIG